MFGFENALIMFVSLLAFSGHPVFDGPMAAAVLGAPQEFDIPSMPPSQMARVELCWVRMEGEFDACRKFPVICDSKIEGDLRAHLLKAKRESGVKDVYLDYYYDISIPLNCETHVIALAEKGNSFYVNLKPFITAQGALMLDFGYTEYDRQHSRRVGSGQTRRDMKPGVPLIMYSERFLSSPASKVQYQHPPYGDFLLVKAQIMDRRIYDVEKN